MVALDFKFQNVTANLSHDGIHFCSLAYELTPEDVAVYTN